VKLLKNKKLLISVISALVLIAVTFLAWPARVLTPTHQHQSQKSKGLPSAQPTFNKQLYPTDTASSLWVIVNKGRALPSDYVPAQLVVPTVPLRLGSAASEMHLRSDAAAAMEAMFAAAKTDNISLMLASGYRSYASQKAVYSSYVAQSGQAEADTFSARPGFSEHQTGLAADVEPASRHCEVDQCFADTPEGRWLAANCYKYGFVIRYQQNTQQLTGYEYEPWHIRYVGKDLAAQLQSSQQTLEQFFGLPAIDDYPAQPLQLKDS
jgi:D-alanyl-D-alanine carboxypeptidase